MTKASYTVISFWYQPLGKRERKCICRISEEWRKSLIKGRMSVRESICLTSLQNCYSMKCLTAEQVSTNTLLKHSWVLKHYSLLWARGKHVWHERNVSRKETTTFTHSSPDSSCWEIWYLWTIIWAALAKCRLGFFSSDFCSGVTNTPRAVVPKWFKVIRTSCENTQWEALLTYCTVCEFG